MTFYESNAEVRPTGAEIEEFVDASPEPAPPPPSTRDSSERGRESIAAAKRAPDLSPTST